MGEMSCVTTFEANFDARRVVFGEEWDRLRAEVKEDEELDVPGIWQLVNRCQVPASAVRMWARATLDAVATTLQPVPSSSEAISC